MKSIAIIVVACVIGVFAADLTEEQKKMLEPYENECFAQTGMNRETMMEIRKEAEKTGRIEFDRDVNCYSACLFRKMDLLDDEGKLEVDMTRAMVAQQIPEEKLNPILQMCKDEVGKDECETVGKLITCFLKNKINL